MTYEQWLSLSMTVEDWLEIGRQNGYCQQTDNVWTIPARSTTNYCNRCGNVHQPDATCLRDRTHNDRTA